MADTKLTLLTRREIERFRRLAKRASPGPWISTDGADQPDEDCGIVRVEIPKSSGVATRLYVCDMENCTGIDLINAEFIAASREMTPRLLDEMIYWRKMYKTLRLDIERRLQQVERLNGLLIDSLYDREPTECNDDERQEDQQQEYFGHRRSHDLHLQLDDFSLGESMNGQDDEQAD